MKPARFDYIRAETLAEAHAALAEDGNEARVIAGGQSLLPMLSMRLARPKVAHRHHASAGAAQDQGWWQRHPHWRRRAAGRTAGVAELGAEPAAARRRPALGRSRADAQPRHRLRLCRACRPECRNSAGSGRARRQRSNCPHAASAAAVSASKFFTGMMSTARDGTK